MAMTTDTLVARSRLYAFEPDQDEGGISDDEVLALADDELQTHCFPRVLMAHEEYAVWQSDQDITASQSAYTVPARAHLSRLRDVLHVDATRTATQSAYGGLATGGTLRSLPVINPEELGGAFGAISTGQEVPRGFYMQGRNLNLWPTPGATTGTLRLKYYARPGNLVMSDECAVVSSISTTDLGSGITRYNVGVTAAPSAWSTNNKTCDLVSATGNCEVLAMSLTLVYVSANTYYIYDPGYLSSTGTRGQVPVVGDWLCLAGYSCIPQVPESCHPWLARRTAAAILEMRESPAAEAARRTADEMEARMVRMLKPRVDGEPTFITTGNSPYRAGGAFRMRYGA